MFNGIWQNLKIEITYKPCVNKMLRSKSLEKKILMNLLENPRMHTIEIARNIGVTRQTVAKKLDQMYSSGVIRSFIPKLDPQTFGLTIQAFIFLREDPRSSFRKKNEETIRRFQEVSEFHRIFGKYDSIIKVLVRNNKELTDFVKKLHHLKAVRDTETFIVHSTIKNQPEDPFKRIMNDTEE